MKQLLFVLSLALFSCDKNDDPEPTPVPNPKSSAYVTITLTSAYPTATVLVNWDSDPEMDTVVTTNSSGIYIAKTVYQNSIGVEAKSKDRSVGDSQKSTLRISVDKISTHSLSDTVFTYKSYALW